MHPFNEYARNITRRHFFFSGANLLGAAALGSLLGEQGARAGDKTDST